MSDTTKIYVYTGSETGYTAGHWYYYDSGSWHDGGTYNSSAVETDKTLSVSDMPADAKVTGDELTDLKSTVNALFTEEEILVATNLAATTNSAITNNNDGSYTIGTTDYGNSTFGYQMTLTPGNYYLYGVPNGIAYLSTVGTSSSYTNRVFENTTNAPKLYHTDSQVQLWVCFRSSSRPSESYTIYPSLIKITPKVDALDQNSFQIKGVLSNGTDLNNVITNGIYLVSSDRSYTHAPQSSGYLMVVSIGSTCTQFFFQYGASNLGTGKTYKRDGNSSGVTSDWHLFNRFFSHTIAFFGDSIMWGRDGSASASTRTTWQIPIVIANSLNVSTINYGVSGQGFLATTESPNTAYDNISGKNLSNFDTIVMCYGVNDGYHDLGEWDSTDETTIMGQFNKIINYIYTQSPTMRIIVIAPFNGTNVGVYPDYWYGPRNNANGYVSRKILSDTLKQACDYYWIPYIEQYDGPITPKNITTLLPDGIHPNDDGYKMIGEWISAKLSSILY